MQTLARRATWSDKAKIQRRNWSRTQVTPLVRNMDDAKRFRSPGVYAWVAISLTTIPFFCPFRGLDKRVESTDGEVADGP